MRWRTLLPIAASCTIVVAACAQALGLDDYDQPAASATGTGGAGASTNSSSTASGASTNSGGAGGGTGGGQIAPECYEDGGIGLLSDDFEDGDPDPLWFPEQSPFTLPEETAGVARFGLNMATQPSASRTAAFRSFDNFSLKGCVVGVELLAALDPGVSGEAFFEVIMAGNVGLSIVVRAGKLFMREIGASNPLGSPSYNAGTHRWLRFREEEGTIYAEYSGDGMSFTAFGQQVSPGDVGSVFVRIGAKADVDVATGFVQFDNVNRFP